MREIEVKAKITNKAVIIDRLKNLGCVLSEPVTQKDTIFVPKGTSLPVGNFVNVLRIREQDGQILLTLKYSVTEQLDKRERELGIDDPAIMALIISDLGFLEIARVEKSRQKCQYQDMEICIDSVVGLGDFIEVERLVEDHKGDGVMASLIEFVKTFGIAESDRVFDGYDVLIYKQSHT